MAEYLPGKNYQWKSTDEFQLTGLELENLVKVVNAYEAELATPEAQGIISKFYAYQTIQSILKKYVESDVIKEAKEKPTD